MRAGQFSRSASIEIRHFAGGSCRPRRLRRCHCQTARNRMVPGPCCPARVRAYPRALHEGLFDGRVTGKPEIIGVKMRTGDPGVVSKRSPAVALFLFEQFYVSMNCARFAEARYGLTSGPPQSYYGHFFYLVRTSLLMKSPRWWKDSSVLHARTSRSAGRDKVA